MSILKNINDFSYIQPNERYLLNVGNKVKYINVDNPKQKIKTGIIVEKTLDGLTLRTCNSNVKWKILFVDNHIYYKNLINNINMLLNIK